MKKNILTILIFLISYNISANNKAWDIEITDFKYLDQINFNCYDEHYDPDTKNIIVKFEMIDSNDQLLMVYNDESKKMRPIIFFSQNPRGIVLKDINNRKEVVSIYNLGNNWASNYIEENDTKVGLALSDSCMGGSTASCISIAVSSCYQDGVCAMMCSLSRWRCIAAIAAACAIHCNDGSGGEE